MTTNDKSDWCLQGQERYLKGVMLVHRRYRQYPKNSSWEHDHCEFCSAKFTQEDHADGLLAGYATEDDYRWICEQRFADLKKTFEWKVVDAQV